jgi:hypothetical protein
MKTCKTCKHWNDTSYSRPEYDQKECTNEEFLHEWGGPTTKEIANQSLVYSYNEGGGFYTGPNFGCIHHTERDDYQEE